MPKRKRERDGGADAELAARLRVIVERNPDSFPAPTAAWLLRAPLFVDAAATKLIEENVADVEARLLVAWDAEAEALAVHRGSFTLDDDREPATELQYPTVLAWRLFEDLMGAADEVEAALEESGQIDPDDARALDGAYAIYGRRDAAAVGAEMQRLIDENPQFFPPWFVERLSGGFATVRNAPTDLPDAMAFFSDAEHGTEIVLVEREFAAFTAGLTRAQVYRELVYTLCHEFEHHFGRARGYDPLGDRE